MALNIKTLGTRSLSAVVFVSVLLGCVVWNYHSFTFFFLVVAMLGLNEFFNVSKKLQAQPYKLAGFITGALTYLSFINIDFLMADYYDKSLFKACLILIPFIICLVALFSKRTNPIQNILFTIFGIIYSVLPFALLHNIVILQQPQTNSLSFEPRLLLGIIFLIWSNDTFAYLGGSLFGKHKMIERISPGKTWEGTIFGIILSFGVSFLLNMFLFPIEGMFWPLMGIAVPLLATVGDLVESMLKRQANIKDTGNIMPGHGGILDRFDSLIFVSPFVFILIKLL